MRWTKVAATVGVFGLLAAACGSDSKDSGAGATTTAAGAVTTAAAGVTTTAAAGPTTTAKPAEETFGQDATNKDLYKGAGGFEIDTTKCPSDWDIDQGISATEIKLAGSLPQSGPLAGFGLIKDGANSYFKYVNENGGVNGASIVYEAKDDAYDPKKTTTNVDEILQSGEAAGLLTIIGTPNNLAVWDNTNAECMPQLLNGTGAAQWGDVENHPWTTGMQLDYFSEAALWAEWIKEQYPNGAKVAAITFNNDFGKSYSAGFKSAIKGSNIELVKEELHEGTAPNLTNQYTSVAATNADVLLLQTSGVFCTQGMGEVEKGSWKPKVMMSATCQSLSQFFKPLVDQGLTGKDTYIIQTFKDVNDPAFADEEFVKLYQETLTKQGLDPKQSTYATGWIFAWYMTEILKLASTYEGGLNRANIMLAARAIDAPMPLLLDGLSNTMNGLKDAYLNEGGRVAQYTVTDPKALGTFKGISDVIDNEGKLGTYAAVQAAQAG